MNRRTFLASAAALAIGGSAALTGCGNNSSSGGGGGSGPISFLSWDGEATMKPVLDGFKAAHPDLSVTATYSPPVAEYIQTLQTRVLSKKAPDVFLIAAENKTNLIGGKAVENLAGKPFMANIPEFNRSTYGGEDGEFGLSIASWGAGILYNKDLLKKVGVETVPTTWDEFLASADEAEGCRHHRLPRVAARHAHHPRGVPRRSECQHRQHHGRQDLRRQRHVRRLLGRAADPVQPDVRRGPGHHQHGRTQGRSGARRVRQGQARLDVDRALGSAHHPRDRPQDRYGDGADPGRFGLSPFLAGAASPGYAISSASENKAAAEAFLTYLGSKEAVEAWQKVSGAISVTTDVEPELDAALAPIVPDVRAGNIYLPQIAWKRSEDILNVEATAQIQQMVQGKVTPEQVAQALDTKLSSS